MTKEEKKNVIIALALCVAAVIIIWFLSRGSNAYAGDYTGDQFNPGDIPDTGTNYANYNILPGSTPDIPGINIGGNTSNEGGCCAPVCGDPNSPNGVSYNTYKYFN